MAEVVIDTLFHDETMVIKQVHEVFVQLDEKLNALETANARIAELEAENEKLELKAIDNREEIFQAAQKLHSIEGRLADMDRLRLSESQARECLEQWKSDYLRQATVIQTVHDNLQSFLYNFSPQSHDAGVRAYEAIRQGRDALADALGAGVAGGWDSTTGDGK